MKNRNICKFIPDSSIEKIETLSFIYETNSDTMRDKIHMQNHRAMLIKQGSGKITIDSIGYSFEAGNLIFIFKEESVEIAPTDNCEYMYIEFMGVRSELLFHRFFINTQNRIFDGFDGLIPLWHDSLCRASEDTIDLASESVLLYTFSRLGGNVTGSESLIARILEITERCFTDSELSLASVAKELSYSAKYLSHVFKEKMGISYSEYLRTMRIKYAVSLFEHGIDSVKNVAFLSGFTDQLYFSTVFKKVIGSSPKEYKKHISKEV